MTEMLPSTYAVIFTSTRSPGDLGYDQMAARMHDMALAQPGCLGVESARGADGFGITVSYRTDEDSIKACRRGARGGSASGADPLVHVL